MQFKKSLGKIVAPTIQKKILNEKTIDSTSSISFPNRILSLPVAIAVLFNIIKKDTFAKETPFFEDLLLTKDTVEGRTRRQTVMTSKSRYFIEASASMIARFARGNVCERIVDHLSPHPLLENFVFECDGRSLNVNYSASADVNEQGSANICSLEAISQIFVIVENCWKKIENRRTLINRSTQPEISIIDFYIAYVPSALAS